MSLTKLEIMERVHERLRYVFSLRKSQEIVEELLEIMKSTLENGEDVMVSGFGKFTVKEKSARKGRNPATNESMMLPARRVETLGANGISAPEKTIAKTKPMDCIPDSL